MRNQQLQVLRLHGNQVPANNTQMIGVIYISNGCTRVAVSMRNQQLQVLRLHGNQGTCDMLETR
jgi:hypothetical protein